MNKFNSIIIKFSILLGLVTVFYFGWQYWLFNNYINTTINLPQQGLIYNIKPGMTLTGVINDLKNKKIITKAKYLLWYARLSGSADNIRVGEFHIPFSSTPKQLLAILVSDKVISYSFTIIEGWSFEQLLDAINNNAVLIHTLKGLPKSEIMSKLELDNVHYEGQFLPDTYLFPRGTSDVDFLKRAYNSMNNYLNSEWQNRKLGLPFDSPYQVLILASIVEKETGQVTERKKIAGVFVRRLHTKMRLQSDPTVIYGMGERYQGNIRRSDLRRKTPYNTYRVFGLPPTPIAMPGRDAIHSTLHPDESNNLYFVARGDGSHSFSTSLKEHNNAVIKYQLKGRKRNFSSYKVGDKK